MAIRTVLHEFRMGDVEDPQIYASQPIYEWQQSEAGKWCMKNCIKDSIVWTTSLDHSHYGYKVVIHGEFEPHDLTYYNLKYNKFEKN